MPLLVESASHNKVNGVYYQTQLQPACFQKDDGVYSVYKTNLSYRFGERYSNSWVLAQANASVDTYLYISPEDSDKPPGFGWVPISGSRPVPSFTYNCRLEDIKSMLSGINITWHHTGFRIKDPAATLPFYQNILGFKYIQKYDFSEEQSSVYYLGTLTEEMNNLKPETNETHEFLWNYGGTVLELRHEWGTENNLQLKYNNGNVEPYRGFGHIAVNAENVYESADDLEKNHGVSFKKRPNEGRMKGIAFMYDPDGYWIEIVKRSENLGFPCYNLSQTMLRVKDPDQSIRFYCDFLGMTLCRQSHFSKGAFSLYFLARLPKDMNYPDSSSLEAHNFIEQLFYPVLELTWNHGTEKDPLFEHHTGNTDPKGFSHLGFLVDNIQETCRVLEENGNVIFWKKPNEEQRLSAIARDPDGYLVKLVEKGIHSQCFQALY